MPTTKHHLLGARVRAFLPGYGVRVSAVVKRADRKAAGTVLVLGDLSPRAPGVETFTIWEKGVIEVVTPAPTKEKS